MIPLFFARSGVNRRLPVYSGACPASHSAPDIDANRSVRHSCHDSDNMMRAILVLAASAALYLLSVVASYADENVREVQTKLRDGGFYSGEIDGAYSSALAAALTRYQVRNGLPVTGQLDIDTSKSLGAKPAVTTSAKDPNQDSDVWRQLRKSRQQSPTKSPNETVASSKAATEIGSDAGSAQGKATSVAAESTGATHLSETASPQTAAPVDTAAKARGEMIADTQPAGSPPPSNAATSEVAPEVRTPSVPKAGSAPAADTSNIRVSIQRGDGSSETTVSPERVRDYVAAFVLAGLDPHVGSEVDFFADRVRYYDDGIRDREAIRKDLQRYNARWPHRTFWLPGEIKMEPQSDNQVRVTFPLRFELHNGEKNSSGQVEKVLVLEPVGDDFQILAVNER